MGHVIKKLVGNRDDDPFYKSYSYPDQNPLRSVPKH